MDFEREYYESDSYWSNGMLQDEANKERIEITINSIPVDVKSIADIGCGNGVFINTLLDRKLNFDILGIDRSNTALKYVNGNKLLSDISNIPLPDKSYDCITCLEVLEHLPVNLYDKAISELCRISKKYIIISVPFEENLEESHNKCPSCSSIFNYELHLRSYAKKDIEGLLSNCNFDCLETKIFGKSFRYKGHYLFRKIFYRKQLMKWNSAICPICGYSEKGQNLTIQPIQNQKRSVISYFTSIPKLFWPKEEKNYWILAVYKKR